MIHSLIPSLLLRDLLPWDPNVFLSFSFSLTFYFSLHFSTPFEHIFWSTSCSSCLSKISLSESVLNSFFLFLPLFFFSFFLFLSSFFFSPFKVRWNVDSFSLCQHTGICMNERNVILHPPGYEKMFCLRKKMKWIPGSSWFKSGIEREGGRERRKREKWRKAKRELEFYLPVRGRVEWTREQKRHFYCSFFSYSLLSLSLSLSGRMRVNGKSMKWSI